MNKSKITDSNYQIKLDENETYKICCKCNRLLPFSSFSPNTSHSDGRHSYCKHCVAKMRRRYAWQGRNMALENIPWPFNEECHEMDIEAIRNHK